MLGIYFGVSNTCGGVRSNGVGENREIDEEHDKDCVKEGLQFARVKFDRGGAGSRKAVWGIVI